MDNFQPEIFVTGGLIIKEDLSDYFDSEGYPYWKRLDLFPLVDQSVYNYVFPKLHRCGRIRLKSEKFMIWSEGAEAKSVQLAEVIAKKGSWGLIHWAGARRTPFVEKMSRADILLFFRMNIIKG